MNSRLVSFVILAAVVLGGVAYGVNFLWDKRFGPTTASAADCRLAQQLIDKAQLPPTDAAGLEKWEQEIRQVRYTRLDDEGLSTQVGRYVHWKGVQSTGGTDRPDPGELDEITDLAIGHCDDSGVDLKLPKIVLS